MTSFLAFSKPSFTLFLSSACIIKSKKSNNNLIYFSSEANNHQQEKEKKEEIMHNIDGHTSSLMEVQNGVEKK